MDLQRVKMASVRGARIQYKAPEQSRTMWREASPPHWLRHWDYRIHPDDAHLEYGPISSALRDWVISGDRFPRDTVESAAAFFMWSRYYNIELQEGVQPASTYEDVELSKLFFAEFFADQGI